jgi:uncharacterized protein YndB with AHSA1/START domain
MQNEKNNTAERQLSFSRLLDAPIELVWDVWTNPKHIQQWWGPDGYHSMVTKMEARPGGEWDLIMIGTDGVSHYHHCVYIEIVKHKKIVYEQQTHFRYVAIIEFEKRDNKTRLTWTMLFESQEYLEQVAKTIGVTDGFKQHSLRLVNYLSQIISKQ